ncbi:hypothetical protein V2J09_016132, partial [Rumex salicifolius]
LSNSLCLSSFRVEAATTALCRLPSEFGDFGFFFFVVDLPLSWRSQSMEEDNLFDDIDKSDDVQRQHSGKLQYGCEHYKRRCKIRSPCCNQVFTCRHCHNEAMSSLSNPKERHELVRYDVKIVICAICEHEQPAAKVCGKCGVNMGEYFCEVCKFYDDEIDKKQFHCHECGICRVGGRENFFHCPKCGSCYSIGLRDNHSCVENSMKNCCPICYEMLSYTVLQYLFDSIKATSVMKCGHTIHIDCLSEMIQQNQCRACRGALGQGASYILTSLLDQFDSGSFSHIKHHSIACKRKRVLLESFIIVPLSGIRDSEVAYRCPICCKSVNRMERIWERLDEEMWFHINKVVSKMVDPLGMSRTTFLTPDGKFNLHAANSVRVKSVGSLYKTRVVVHMNHVGGKLSGRSGPSELTRNPRWERSRHLMQSNQLCNN